MFPVDKILGSAGRLEGIWMCEVQFLFGVLVTHMAPWALKSPRTGFSLPFLSKLTGQEKLVHRLF